MKRSIFVNLPVMSLERSIVFFKKLGFSFDKDFTNDKAASMIVSDTASVMLLTTEFFQSFTKKPIADPNKSPEVIIAFNAESNEEVDMLAAKVQDSGGKIIEHYTEMESSMYGVRFEDPEGHLWEIFYMDRSKRFI